MAVLIQDNLFAEERARRYISAMSACPTARYLEVLPLLCLCAREEKEQCSVDDLASRGGYLGSFFEGVADRVTYVDRSPDMLRHVKSDDIVIGDIRHASSAVGEAQADLVTCLAAFHHLHVPDVSDINGVAFDEPNSRYWTPERYLQIEESQELHHNTLYDWSRILKPGGQLVLIDVPGYPDPNWDPFWSSYTPHSMNTRGYQESFIQELGDWSLDVEPSILSRYFDIDGWRNLWNDDSHLADIKHGLNGRGDIKTMKDLVQSYRFPIDRLNENGPMVPTDFFDDVVDYLSTQRHFGYFPREAQIRYALSSAGMEEIRTGTFPTPWVFANKREAAWFVHELFSFGTPWQQSALPEGELEQFIEAIDRYLGFHEDGYGRTVLYWQLSYFVAQMP